MKYKGIAPHKKLLVWQKSFDLAKEVYCITEKFPKEEVFGITQQIRRAVVSVVSNIAEGASRTSNKEKLQFFTMSRGSLAELETQLMLAKELGYFNNSNMFIKIEEVERLLNGLIRNRRKSIKYFVTLCFTIYYLLSATCYIFSAFQNTDWSVRAEGMGGVFTAISDEPSGLYYNPAGIAGVTKKCVQTMYAKPYSGIEGLNFSLINLSAVVPLKYLKIGIASNIYDVQDGLYRETSNIVTVATVLKNLHRRVSSVQLGLNLKYLTKKYNYDWDILQAEPAIKDKKDKSVISTDFGILCKILKNRLSFGMCVKDVTQPDISVLENSKDIIPMTVSFGSAYNFGDVKAGLYFEDLTVAVELRYRNQQWGTDTAKLFYGVGFETYFNFHTVALRFGVNKNSVNLGFGYYGIKIGDKIRAGFNYAFGLSTLFSDNFGNHRVAVEVRF